MLCYNLFAVFLSFCQVLFSGFLQFNRNFVDAQNNSVCCTQFVKIGSIQSNPETITCGIPQGSTLGPLLFLLYINGLPNCSKKLSFRIFADDTNMFFPSDNLYHLESIMNEELNLVFKYCNINKLSINFTKTTYMIMSSAR